jgi:hypothetical protein
MYKQQTTFVMINVETCIAKYHPLRAIKQRSDYILFGLRKDFNGDNNSTGILGVLLDSSATNANDCFCCKARDIQLRAAERRHNSSIKPDR